MRLKYVVALFGFCIASNAALGMPPLTPGQNPTAPIIPDRPSADRPEIPDLKSKPPQPSLIVPDAPAEQQKSATETPKIYINGFHFTGHTLFSKEALEAIAAPYTGRAVSIAELEQLRYLLTAHYVDKGYLNSGVVLPSQSFENGMIRFEIIEGTLNEIKITGTEHLNPNYVRDRLMIDAGPPLNTDDLENRFRLLLQDPLIERMEGRLSPSLTPGQSILDLNVTRAKPYYLTLSFDNHRPPSTGAEQVRLNGKIHNLTGFGDSLDGLIGYSEGSYDFGGGFSIPVTRYDTKLFFRAYFSRASIIEEPLDDIDIESKFRNYEFGIEQPIFRSFERSFYMSAKMALRKNRNTLEGKPESFETGDNNGESKVSVLRFSQDYIQRDSRQVFTARSTFNVGINAFGATWNRDGSADGDFFSWLGQLQYGRQIMDNGAQLLLRGDVQVSNDELLALEQFAVGGAYSVRGYRENERVRDQGFALSIEFRYPLLSGVDFPGTLTAIPFMDYGGAWGINESDNIDYLHSVGIGMVWVPIRQITAELFYAHDLNTARPKPDWDLQDSGVHFRLAVQLL